MLKIRFSRSGTKHKPFYRVIVAEARGKQKGKALETIGFYNPTINPPMIEIKKERLNYWHKLGAQLTPAVNKLLKK